MEHSEDELSPAIGLSSLLCSKAEFRRAHARHSGVRARNAASPARAQVAQIKGACNDSPNRRIEITIILAGQVRSAGFTTDAASPLRRAEESVGMKGVLDSPEWPSEECQRAVPILRGGTRTTRRYPYYEA
eukprot:1603952-Pleurochrysis_carterae.AAC.1